MRTGPNVRVQFVIIMVEAAMTLPASFRYVIPSRVCISGAYGKYSRVDEQLSSKVFQDVQEPTLKLQRRTQVQRGVH